MQTVAVVILAVLAVVALLVGGLFWWYDGYLDEGFKQPTDNTTITVIYLAGSVVLAGAAGWAAMARHALTAPVIVGTTATVVLVATLIERHSSTY